MFVSDKEMQYPGNESSTTLECSVSPEGVTPQIFGFGGGRRWEGGNSFNIWLPGKTLGYKKVNFLIGFL